MSDLYREVRLPDAGGRSEKWTFVKVDPAEVLAEMDTELIYEELRKRWNADQRIVFVDGVRIVVARREGGRR